MIILVSTYVVYVSKKSTAAEDDQLTGIQKWMNNKFYIDELYQSVVQKPIEAIKIFEDQLNQMVKGMKEDGGKGSEKVAA